MGLLYLFILQRIDRLLQIKPMRIYYDYHFFGLAINFLFFNHVFSHVNLGLEMNSKNSF